MKKEYFTKAFISILFIASALKVSSQATVVLRAGGNITTASDWGAAPNGTSSTLANFAANNTYSFTNLNTALSLSSAWNITSASTVVIGNGTNAFTLTLASGGVIGTTVQANQPRIQVKAAATFIIQDASFPQNASNTKTVYSPSSTVIYSTNAPDIIAPSGGFSNLVIDDNIALSTAGADVNRTLTVNSGFELDLGNLDIDIGAIAGSGVIVGNSGSIMNFAGLSGNLGTLNFKAGSRELGGLNLPASTSTITLGTDLQISDGNNASAGLFLNSTSINLNGHKLTIAGTAAGDFGSGSIFGSASSTLELNGSTGYSGSLNMATGANSLSVLSINSPNNSVTLGNTLNIMDFVSATDGTIASGGNLVLIANASDQAYIAPMGSTGAISGNVTVNSFFPGVGNTGWCLLGSNGVNGPTVGSWNGQFPITCVGCTHDPSVAGGFYSVQDWNEGNCDFDITLTSGTSLSPGKGYWVYLGSGSGATSALSWSLAGTVNQQVVNVNCTFGSSCASSTYSPKPSDGYNLVANPYACPISLENLAAITGNGAGAFTGTWHIYERNGGEKTYNTLSHTGNFSSNNDVIPAGNGFYAECDGFSNQTLVFNESAKFAAGVSTSMYRSNAVVNQVKLKLKGTYDSDVAVFVINEMASTNFEHYDSRKMFQSAGYAGGNAGYSKYTTISSYEPSSKHYLAINAFPSNSTTKSIPVLVRVSTSGTYTISAFDFDNYGSCAVLHDKLTNVYTDLKIKPYTFSISDTTQSPRFELLVCANGAEPVSVKELSATSNLSIHQDADGVFVKSSYTDNTKSTVSVYNLIGQKIIDDFSLEGSQTVHLNLNDKNQVVLIKVVSEKESLSKKIILH